MGDRDWTDWNQAKFLVLRLWDVIYIWIIAAVYIVKQFLEPNRKPTGIKRRNGHVAIVTGGSSGIGLEIVRQLLEQGMHTIIVAIDPYEEKIIKMLSSEFPSEKIEYFKVDISNLKDVRNFAEKFIQRKLPLHLLINNAGIMFAPYRESVDGYESQLATNYLGHFLLTQLLLPKLIETGSQNLRSRIVSVSSCCHYGAYRYHMENLCSRKFYSPYGSYAQSKLAIVMHTIDLDEMLKQKNAFVNVNAVHPGVIRSNLYQYSIISSLFVICRWLFQTPRQGANGIVHVALSDELEEVSGKYFENCSVVTPNTVAQLQNLRYELRKKACSMVGIEHFDEIS